MGIPKTGMFVSASRRDVSTTGKPLELHAATCLRRWRRWLGAMSVALVSTAAFAAPSAVANTTGPSCSAGICTQTFDAQGDAPQAFTVPNGVNSLSVQVAGAEGGNLYGSSDAPGGETDAALSVTPGEMLTLIVGGQGGGGYGGYGGGGASNNSAGGGGGSFVGNTSALLLAAGGGGGNGDGNAGGAGAGAGQNADNGTNYPGYSGLAGNGATPTGGGAPGCFDGGYCGGAGGGPATSTSPGTGGDGRSETIGGGGGGGYYGGGGGTYAGGGGGSGYADPSASQVTGTLGGNAGPGFVTFTYSSPATDVTVSLTPPSITADGSSTSTVTATVTDLNGDPMSGDTVTIGSSGAQTVGPVTAGASPGTYQATITSTTAAGQATITATDTTAGQQPSGTTTLTQVAGPATGVALALAPSSVVANGTSTSTATATVTDQNGNPVSGDTVTFESSGSQTVGAVRAGSSPGTYQATITSTTAAGQATITATDISAGAQPSGTTTLTQVAPTTTPPTTTQPISTPPTTTSPTVVPAVAHCDPRPTGRLTARTLGRLRLGMTRARSLRMYADGSSQGRRYWDFFCLAGGKVRVAYASPRLLKTLSSSQRHTFRGRVALALTANPYYALHGIRAGASLRSAARALHTGAAFQVGLNDWYMAPDGVTTTILKVRHGIVQEIGIADATLTHTRRAERAFITSFS